jgi:hypothetical protein
MTELDLAEVAMSMYGTILRSFTQKNSMLILVCMTDCNARQLNEWNR